MKVQIVIQETTAGLHQQFVSSNFDITNEAIKSSLNDERNLAAQIANQSTVYSAQVIDRYRVYSGIYTNITDSSGRPGYFAVKVYLGKEFIVNNIIDLLTSIKDAYVNFKKTNQLNNQNYDGIIERAEVFEIARMVCPRYGKNCFVHYENQDEAAKFLNDKRIFATERLYLFDSQKALKSEVISNQGMQSFAELIKNIETFNIDNSSGILKLLIFGDTKFPAASFPQSFSSLKKRGEKLKYLTSDNAEEQSANIFNDLLTVSRKYVQEIPKHQPTRNIEYRKPEQSFLEKLKIPLLLVLVSAIGLTIYFLFFREHEFRQETTENVEIKDSVETKIIDESTFKFIDTTFGDLEAYKTAYNDSLKSRIFWKNEVDSACYLKNMKSNSQYPNGRALKRDDFEDLDLKDSLKVDQFLKELAEKCSCLLKEKRIIAPSNTGTQPANTDRPKEEKTDPNDDPVMNF